MKKIALFCLSNGGFHGTGLREGVMEVSLNGWLVDNIRGVCVNIKDIEIFSGED